MVEVVADLPANAQAAEPVQQRDRSFHAPPVHAQAGAVPGAAPGTERLRDGRCDHPIRPSRLPLDISPLEILVADWTAQAVQGDHGAAGCSKFLPQQRVVVMECGNGGGGGVQAALESGALAGLLGELAP